MIDKGGRKGIDSITRIRTSAQNKRVRVGATSRGIEKLYHRDIRKYGQVQGYLCGYSSSNGVEEIIILI